MSPVSDRTSTPTIQNVLAEFLDDRQSRLAAEEHRLYRHVLFFLELCINNYGHRNLDALERARYERIYAGLGGPARDFFEVFGPEKLLPELEYFTGVYLKKEVHTSDRVTRKAPEVVAALRKWLLDSGKVTRASAEEQERHRRLRTRLKSRMSRLRRVMEKGVVPVQDTSLDAFDHVPLDAHPIVKIQPGRIWLGVFSGANVREIGPVRIPVAATAGLKAGWNLCCALGRLRGRWRIIELEGIHPCFAEPVREYNDGRGDGR